jgi:hypothetical protein
MTSANMDVQVLDRASFDDLAWDKNDEDQEESKQYFVLASTFRKVESLASRELGKSTKFTKTLIKGGYNYLFRLEVNGGADNDVLVRLPQPYQSMFPVEKTFREAQTAIFVAQNTRIHQCPGCSDMVTLVKRARTSGPS